MTEKEKQKKSVEAIVRKGEVTVFDEDGKEWRVTYPVAKKFSQKIQSEEGREFIKLRKRLNLKRDEKGRYTK